jgi:RNA polymerase sigma factor (sigma-70 family)
MTESTAHPLSDEAAYRRLRAALIRSFRAAGLADAENLSDEVIRRVLTNIGNGTSPDSLPVYARAIARNVRNEEVRRLIHAREIADATMRLSGTACHSTHDEICLSKCLAALSLDDQALLRDYYAFDGRSRIDQHRALAERLGISSEALSTRVHRLRKKLLQCLVECKKIGTNSA